jgi:hypothetical protein
MRLFQSYFAKPLAWAKIYRSYEEAIEALRLKAYRRMSKLAVPCEWTRTHFSLF